ncbi:class F sortase [Nesterenkonia sp. CF4.4]|uniref:class F sortase n=1 Tax=Nesterenkonia sp. CF4.4 TaxID=3373079 RepID=UPI003EE598DF
MIRALPGRPDARVRRLPLRVAAALALGLSLSACGTPASPSTLPEPEPSTTTEDPASSSSAKASAEPDSEGSSSANSSSAGSGASSAETGVRPVAVNIPSIDVEEALIDLGIAEDGTMEVPEDFSEVGWFDGGGMPGGRGPTVLAGHLDSTTGPAVFHRLVEMQPGDDVEVTDAEGEVHLYRVERTEVFAKDDFPTREVFGALPEDELRLITCTGIFDFEAGSHEDNHIVFAVPVEDPGT